MKNCKLCRHELKDDQNVCPRCGTLQDESLPVKKQRDNSGLLIAVLVVVAILLIVGGVVLLLLGRGNKEVKGVVYEYYQAINEKDSDTYAALTLTEEMRLQMENTVRQYKDVFGEMTLEEYLYRFELADGKTYNEIYIKNIVEGDETDRKNLRNLLKSASQVDIEIESVYTINVSYKYKEADTENWQKGGEVLTVFGHDGKLYVRK